MNLRMTTLPLLASIFLPLAGCSPPVTVTEAPIDVVVSAPVERPVVDFFDFTGRTESTAPVLLRSRIGGYIDKINFKDGQEVTENQVLFEIDDRMYQAQAKLAKAQVKLQDAIFKEAEFDYRRNLAARPSGAVTEEELEKSMQKRSTAQAQLDASRANLTQQELDLAYCKVKAPIPGRSDRDYVSVGNLVSADNARATVLTTVVTLQPMYVYFTVDEPTLLHLRQLVQEGKVPSPDKKNPAVLLGIGNGTQYPFEGTIDFISNRVDPATGTLLVRGTFANKELILRPGLFARIRLPVGEPHPVLLVSEGAILSRQGKPYVYVVDDKNNVAERPVKVGPLSGGLRIIEEGLQPHVRVIIDGMLRVKEGSMVKPTTGEMTPAPGELTRPTEAEVAPPGT